MRKISFEKKKKKKFKEHRKSERSNVTEDDSFLAEKEIEKSMTEFLLFTVKSFKVILQWKMSLFVVTSTKRSDPVLVHNKFQTENKEPSSVDHQQQRLSSKDQRVKYL